MSLSYVIQLPKASDGPSLEYIRLDNWRFDGLTLKQNLRVELVFNFIDVEAKEKLLLMAPVSAKPSTRVPARILMKITRLSNCFTMIITAAQLL